MNFTQRLVMLFFVACALVVASGVAVVALAEAGVIESKGAHKEKISRDDTYYEIVNDNDDHGNFIETYHLPNGRGGKVYCIVYSDKIGKGGGAGMDCDWGHPS